MSEQVSITKYHSDVDVGIQEALNMNVSAGRALLMETQGVAEDGVSDYIDATRYGHAIAYLKTENVPGLNACVEFYLESSPNGTDWYSVEDGFANLKSNEMLAVNLSFLGAFFRVRYKLIGVLGTATVGINIVLKAT